MKFYQNNRLVWLASCNKKVVRDFVLAAETRDTYVGNGFRQRFAKILDFFHFTPVNSQKTKTCGIASSQFYKTV